jgi:photosystem II stability/assembly factor-like uncharacterized protein
VFVRQKRWTIAATGRRRFFRPAVETLEGRVLPATFMVLNTNDSGAGSLRQAILDSNNTSGPNTIQFSIGSGVQTITPRSPLPTVFIPVTIDGTSQPGYNGTPIIELNGSQAGTNTDGLILLAGNSTVQGLVINRFSLDGLAVQNNGGSVIQGNYIGTDVTGTHALGNGRQGMLVNCANNTIDNNLISGNGLDGLQIAGTGVTGNVVQGNFIGTDASGTLPLGNGRQGMLINSQASANTIGGSLPGAGNVISANHSDGLQLADAGTTGNVVQGNFIGTDASGTLPLGNGRLGMLINFGTQGNAIGGTGSGAGNIIAANVSDGVELGDTGTSSNVVQGNSIGTDASGSLDLGNGRVGVLIYGGAHGNRIDSGNMIAFNKQPGVAVVDVGTVGNAIRGNSIYSNGGLGIDLGWDGVTVNHAGGSTTGPNDWQNYPVLTAAASGNTTTVSGTLNGLPNTTFTLDFYGNSTPDITYFGQGEQYLDSITVTTDATGNASFDAVLNAATNDLEWLSATATDPAGNTSEFSGAVQLPYGGLGINSKSWTPIGPAPVASSPLFNGPVVAGRIDVAVPDPNDPNVMYVGADGGGIWKTTDWLDPSPLWTPLTDNQPSLNFNNLAYQALAVYPSFPTLLYAAVSGPGGGILKSYDAGASWSLLGNGLFDRAYFGSLVINPNDPNMVYVTVRGGNTPGGVYQSTDGGQSWVNLTANLHAGLVTDLAMDPTNPAVLYAGLTLGRGATNGVYKTTDGGMTWTRLSNGLPASSGILDSIRLAVAPSDPQTVYATVFTSPNDTPVRYKTTNGGASWSPLTPLPGGEENRYWHALLSVDPTDGRIVYANGDGPLFRSTDGGATWTQIYAEDPISVSFDGAGNVVLVGDRGIYSWAGPGTTFANKQGDLQVSQLYTLTLDPTNPTVAYGIAQDHFAYLKFSGYSVWNYLGGAPGNPDNGGETGKVLVDPTNPNRIYAYDPNDCRSFILRSDDGGADWIEKGSGIPTGLCGFNLAYTAQKAFVMDPSNSARLLVGTTQVYQTTNAGDSWTAISPVLSAGHYITALAIAPSAPNVIFAATDDGRLFVTQNGGASWQEKDGGLPHDFADHVVDIEVDPLDPTHAFIVPGTFPTNVLGNRHVWTTTDGGTSWTDIGGGLPPTYFTNSLAVDWRFATPVLYVGTARGVYCSPDLGMTWSSFGQDLPNTAVTDLQFLQQFDLLAAATYGRGVFEIMTPDPGGRPGGAGPRRAERPLRSAFSDIGTSAFPARDPWDAGPWRCSSAISPAQPSPALAPEAVSRAALMDSIFTAATGGDHESLPLRMPRAREELPGWLELDRWEGDIL